MSKLAQTRKLKNLWKYEEAIALPGNYASASDSTCYSILSELAISYFKRYIESSGEKHNSMLEYAKRRLAALKEEEFMSQAR